MIYSIKYNGVTYRKHPKQKYYYSSKCNSRYSRSLHRQTWFDNFGEIPAGYDVHHVDNNHENNDISNLELISRSDHAKMHMRERVLNNPDKFKELAAVGRPLTKEWHASSEGIEWHKKHAAETNFGKYDYGTYNCECCSNEFNKKTIFAKFCSNKCKSKYRRINKLDHIDRVCKCCSVNFKSCKYTGSEFCSKNCSSKFI